MRHLKSLVASLIGALLLTMAQLGAFGSTPYREKVDRYVPESQQASVPVQSVIITVKSGYKGTLRTRLQSTGDVAKSDHTLIEAVDADIKSSSIDDLANQDWVSSIAADSDVANTSWSRHDYTRDYNQVQTSGYHN